MTLNSKGVDVPTAMHVHGGAAATPLRTSRMLSTSQEKSSLIVVGASGVEESELLRSNGRRGKCREE